MERWIGLIGLLSFVAIPYFLCRDKKYIRWQTIYWGLGLQFLFALLILGIPFLGVEGWLRPAFSAANDFVIAILGYTDEGSRFLFGPLESPEKAGGFIFAVKVLPTIIFMSSLVAVAYHIGIMQKAINFFARIMQKTMKTSGAESLSAAANIFVGQTEAPLVVKPFISKMTNSELMAIMTGGMATVAGAVLAAYVGLLKDRIPDIAGHLLTASLMSAPAALAIAKLLMPEKSETETSGKMPKSMKKVDVNIIEAAARGAGEGVHLAINVGAMLLAFIALVALVNGGLGYVGEFIGFENSGSSALSLQMILGWCFSPLAWLMGIPWSESQLAGSLIGEKIALNEFVAYLHLSEISSQLSDRTVIILSYALCGFANFSSIAIQIGGIGGMAPERKSDLAKLGLKSILGGSLAAFMTATIAGLLI